MAQIKTDKEFAKLDKITDKLINKQFGGITREYKETLKNLRVEASQLYDKYSSKGQLTFADMQKYDRLEKLKTVITKKTHKLYNNTDKITKNILKQVYADSFDFTRETVENITEKSIRAIIKSEIVEKALNIPLDGLTLPDRLERDRAKTILDIRKTFQKNFAEGKSYGELSKDLQKTLEISHGKAKTIVRTEGHRLMETGKNDSMQSAVKQGVEVQKTWKSSQDERVRASHVELEGQTVDFDDDFVNPKTGGRGKHPGSLGTGADDINCRCYTSYDITE